MQLKKNIFLALFSFFIYLGFGQKPCGYLGSKNQISFNYSPSFNTLSQLSGYNTQTNLINLFSASYIRTISNKTSLGISYAKTKFLTSVPVFIILNPSTFRTTYLDYNIKSILVRRFKLKKGAISPIGKYNEYSIDITKNIFGIFYKIGQNRAISNHISLDYGVKTGLYFKTKNTSNIDMKNTRQNNLLRFYLGLSLLI